MSTTKKQIRENFRNTVFKRDGYKCRVCGNADSPLDAHHICDRRDMPNGGYIPENGIALCEVCHTLAECWHASGQTHFEVNYHPDDLYTLIGSSYQIAREADGGT